MLHSIRTFFYQQQVLEVDTPVLSNATTSDPFIESFSSQYLPLSQSVGGHLLYLHSSPEFPMKRLLAAGSGAIFQVAKVFRQGESGRKHNPEFTLLEWYRPDWDHFQLMTEVEQLLRSLLLPHLQLAETEFVTYQQAFENRLNINPHSVTKQQLLACVATEGLANVLDDNEAIDRFLELLFSHIIEPDLGKSKTIDGKTQAGICFLYHYPQSQASLARIAQHDDQRVAERFEVFIGGMEIANGFHELNNAQEQRKRFESDNLKRAAMGFQQMPMDEFFLAALEQLPDCAGVAIGIERVLMVMKQLTHINEVISFPIERA